MISAEMIAPLLEQLTAEADHATAAIAVMSPWGYGHGYQDGRSAAFTDAVVLVSTWAAGVQS